MKKAAFLDRDGTIIFEPDEWITSPRNVELLEGSGEAIRRLNEAGYKVIVVTNQSGVARGFINEEDLPAIHEEMRSQLLPYSAHIDEIYYCPHHPSAGVGKYLLDCPSRKPHAGMLRRALREHNVTLEGSLVIGDDIRDIRLASTNSLRPALVRTGKGREREAEAVREFGDRLTVSDDLHDAVIALLENDRQDSD